MDEFISIGWVDIIVSVVSFMVGYNLCLMFIVQSLLQLELIYGKEYVCIIMINYVLQIIFVLCEQYDVNEYSDMLGYISMCKDSVSCSRLCESSYMCSESDECCVLMLLQEFKVMGDDKEILFVEGMVYLVMVDKIWYYQDLVFKEWLLFKVLVLLLILLGSEFLVFYIWVDFVLICDLMLQILLLVVQESVEFLLVQQYEVYCQCMFVIFSEYIGLVGI